MDILNYRLILFEQDIKQSRFRKSVSRAMEENNEERKVEKKNDLAIVVVSNNGF